MMFLFTIGRVTVFHVTLFEIADKIEDPDIVVVHHYKDDEDEEKGPGDLFGGKE